MTFLMSLYTALLIAGCLKLVLIEYRRVRRTEQLLQLLDGDQSGASQPQLRETMGDASHDVTSSPVRPVVG